MVKIKFFALLREMTGKEEMLFEMPRGLQCREIISSLRGQFPSLAPVLSSCLVAVNGDYAEKETVLSEGDELALLPPVSGG